MAKKFEFKKNTLELDIAGEVFNIDMTDPELIDNAEKSAQDMIGWSEKAEKVAGEQGQAKAMEMSIQLCIDAIDGILGDGATKKIFKDRKINFFDCLDILEFLKAEMEQSKTEKLQQYTPNRAQRRAQK